MELITIKAYTEDASQIEAIKAVIKAFKIKYTISKEDNVTYSDDFVRKIKKSEEDLQNGKGVKISLDDLENLCK